MKKNIIKGTLREIIEKVGVENACVFMDDNISTGLYGLNDGSFLAILDSSNADKSFSKMVKKGEIVDGSTIVFAKEFDKYGDDINNWFADGITYVLERGVDCTELVMFVKEHADEFDSFGLMCAILTEFGFMYVSKDCTIIMFEEM